MMNLDEIFTYTDETFRLTVDQEREAIVLAQGGDPDATEALLRAYGRTLRKTVGKAKKVMDEEEARATALVAFTEVLQSHDVEDENYADPRLASRLKPHLLDSLGQAQAGAEAFTIPKRTLTRFHGILRAADGAPERGVEICESMGMSRDVFLATLDAVGTGALDESASDEDGRDRIESATPLFADSHEADVEDRLLIETAFAAVDDEEARIIELRYGFRSTEDYAAGEEIPDGEVAKIVGLTRPTVQRRRASGLEKMREATGVTPVEQK